MSTYLSLKKHISACSPHCFFVLTLMHSFKEGYSKWNLPLRILKCDWMESSVYSNSLTVPLAETSKKNLPKIFTVNTYHWNCSGHCLVRFEPSYDYIYICYMTWDYNMLENITIFMHLWSRNFLNFEISNYRESKLTWIGLRIILTSYTHTIIIK